MSSHDAALLRELERAADHLAQLEAIAKATRLPGEIAGTYCVTAEIILQIHHKARASEARRRYEAPKDKAGKWRGRTTK